MCSINVQDLANNAFYHKHLLLLDVDFSGLIVFDASNTISLEPTFTEEAMERERTNPWWTLAEIGDNGSETVV